MNNLKLASYNEIEKLNTNEVERINGGSIIFINLYAFKKSLEFVKAVEEGFNDALND